MLPFFEQVLFSKKCNDGSNLYWVVDVWIVGRSVGLIEYLFIVQVLVVSFVVAIVIVVRVDLIVVVAVVVCLVKFS